MFNPKEYIFPSLARRVHENYQIELDSAKRVGQGGGYIVGRPLGEEKEAIGYSHTEANTYHQVLPLWQGKTFETWLREGCELEDEIVWCDLGFGAGVAQIELLNKEPFKSRADEGMFRVIAIGNPYYSRYSFSRPDEHSFVNPPTIQELERLNVEIDPRDILEALWKMEDESVDVFTAALSLNYVDYPNWEIIKEIGRVLKLEGKAFLSDIELIIMAGDQYIQDDRVNEIMTKLGITLVQDDRGIALKKFPKQNNIRSHKNGWKPGIVISGK